jgi:hypothetical protein
MSSTLDAISCYLGDIRQLLHRAEPWVKPHLSKEEIMATHKAKVRITWHYEE